MSIAIRAMQPSDLEACAKIIDGLAFFQDWGLTGVQASSSLAEALGDVDSDVRVAEVDGVVVGFTWLLKQGAFGRSPYLRLIATLSASQGRGVGRCLMHALEADFLSAGGLFLLVTQTNHSARAFYEHLGYRLVGTLPDYVKAGVAECLYFKPAPAA